MTTLDDLRARYPHLGFAVYAYEPGGDVTLECLNEAGESFTFVGLSLEAAIAAGFADDVGAADAAPHEPTAPTPEQPQKTQSVFD